MTERKKDEINTSIGDVLFTLNYLEESLVECENLGVRLCSLTEVRELRSKIKSSVTTDEAGRYSFDFDLLVEQQKIRTS